MAAGWNAFKDQSMKPPPKYVLDESTINGPINRSFRLRWIQGKRDDGKEYKLMTWISRLINENPPQNADFGEWLKSGQVLCKLINRIQPGSISKIHTKGEYALRENVANFTQGCRRYGLKEEDCFGSTDLCEGTNLGQVAATLFSLADLAHARDQSIPLP